MRVWQIVKRELHDIFVKDRRRANFIFGASIAYLVIFGLLYGEHIVKNVPIVIYDEDQTKLSRSLVQFFADSERFNLVGQPASQEEMEQMLYEQTAYAAIDIPYDFSRNITAGRSSPVLLIANGMNLLVTNTITTATQEILLAFNQEVSTKLGEWAGLSSTLAHNKTAPIEIILRVLNNPTLSYRHFFVIGLAMATFQQGIFLSVGASIVSEYNNLRELAAAHPWQVMVGKLLPYFVFATVSFFVTLLIAIHVFDIPCKGDFISLFCLATTFSLTAIGVSSLLASFCTSEITFTKISLTYSVPAFTLSGYIWPLASMDGFSQIIAYTFPLFYFSDAVRDVMLAGYSPFLYRNIVVLLVLGLTLISLSTFVYAHKRHRLELTKEQPDDAEVTVGNL
jgi:ABC-2 type transport system permease protein